MLDNKTSKIYKLLKLKAISNKINNKFNNNSNHNNNNNNNPVKYKMETNPIYHHNNYNTLYNLNLI